MRTRIEPHSGDLAIVVPADMAARAGLRAGDPVDVELAGGRLVVGPARAETLAELVARITPENLHVAWDDGSPVGRELLGPRRRETPNLVRHSPGGTRVFDCLEAKEAQTRVTGQDAAAEPAAAELGR